MRIVETVNTSFMNIMTRVADVLYINLQSHQKSKKQVILYVIASNKASSCIHI